MRPRLPALPALGLLYALASGCAAVTPAAAIVNGQRISESDVQHEVNRVERDPRFQQLVRQQGDSFRGTYRREVLSRYIRWLVVRQEARHRALLVTARDVTAFIDDRVREAGGPKAWSAFLQQNYLTPAQARVLTERVVYEQRLQRLVTKNLTVDEASVKAFYDQNHAAFTQLHLARITVLTQDDAKQVVDAANGGADFAALARQKSQDEAAAKGGDLGYVDATSLQGGVASQLEAAAVGTVAGPFSAQSGFEVYKVLDRRDKPLDAVRSQIVDQLLSQQRTNAFNTWIGARERRAHIRVNPKYGRFDPSRVQVVAGPGSLPE